MNLKEEMESSMMEGIMETFMPKIEKLAGPLWEKLKNYLGDDEKIIVIRTNSKNKSPHAIVLKTSEDVEIVFSKDKKKFTASKEAVEHFFNGEEFIQALVSGTFTKSFENNVIKK